MQGRNLLSHAELAAVSYAHHQIVEGGLSGMRVLVQKLNMAATDQDIFDAAEKAQVELVMESRVGADRFVPFEDALKIIRQLKMEYNKLIEDEEQLLPDIANAAGNARVSRRQKRQSMATQGKAKESSETTVEKLLLDNPGTPLARTFSVKDFFPDDDDTDDDDEEKIFHSPAKNIHQMLRHDFGIDFAFAACATEESRQRARSSASFSAAPSPTKNEKEYSASSDDDDAFVNDEEHISKALWRELALPSIGGTEGMSVLDHDPADDDEIFGTDDEEELFGEPVKAQSLVFQQGSKPAEQSPASSKPAKVTVVEDFEEAESRPRHTVSLKFLVKAVKNMKSKTWAEESQAQSDIAPSRHTKQSTQALSTTDQLESTFNESTTAHLAARPTVMSPSTLTQKNLEQHLATENQNLEVKALEIFAQKKREAKRKENLKQRVKETPDFKFESKQFSENDPRNYFRAFLGGEKGFGGMAHRPDLYQTHGNSNIYSRGFSIESTGKQEANTTAPKSSDQSAHSRPEEPSNVKLRLHNIISEASRTFVNESKPEKKKKKRQLPWPEDFIPKFSNKKPLKGKAMIEGRMLGRIAQWGLPAGVARAQNSPLIWEADRNANSISATAYRCATAKEKAKLYSAH